MSPRCPVCPGLVLGALLTGSGGSPGKSHCPEKFVRSGTVLELSWVKGGSSILPVGQWIFERCPWVQRTRALC